MTGTLFDQPILNSPYAEPSRHHDLDEKGRSTERPLVEGRRRSDHTSPVPEPRRRRSKKGGGEAEQKDMALRRADGFAVEGQEYTPTEVINEIRRHVADWRGLTNPRDWGVTPATQRLLEHWRHHDFQGVRPFFCQIEAVETVIWLTEVARGDKARKWIWTHLENGNAGANPGLVRLALKMATGAGKTTVMAMLIAWQTINAVRSPASKLFTRGFLIVTPGITIRDRLRVLRPADPDSYYKDRELVPADMMNDIQKAKIVITNYHAFQLREKMTIGKVGKALLQGRGGVPPNTTETEGEMVRRVAGELMGLGHIAVINDEAHHCYRGKPGGEAGKLTGDEREEAKENNKAAHLWIGGLEAFKKKLGLRGVYDLSATPFFLAGSGWAEGTLFPWTVSDFSLMDAIECGIVKLPRIPVDDNNPGADRPVFRDFWDHIGKKMPKKGGQIANPAVALPDPLQSALQSLYGHYEKTHEAWAREGIDTPPVFIVVCNNTTTSRLVYEWISGWQRAGKDDKDGANGQQVTQHHGHLPLFSNFDEHGTPLALPNTLLIDSRQIESGEGLDRSFRDAATAEIATFRSDRVKRGDHGAVSDEELLREVMNTVGKKDRLGANIRCVVSVSMLTEGWDASTVTHILGVRAFGTQLLCEQVVGRALRRLSYDLNAETGLFDSEYADILGIPFNFATEPVLAPPKPPKKTVHVRAVPERAGLEIRFPRVTGYRVRLPEDKLSATFTEASSHTIEHDKIGASQTDMSGIVGEGHTLSLQEAQEARDATIAFHLAAAMLKRHFTDRDGEPEYHLFGQIRDICRRWLDEGHLKCPGDTERWMLITYPDIMASACGKIFDAITRAAPGDANGVIAVIDPWNPEGSTRHVSFSTVKDVRDTDPRRCHVNYVVCDSDWEAEFTRCAEKAENRDRVLAYVKNQGLGLEIPWMDGASPRNYRPDFIVQVDDGRGPQDPLNVIIEIKGLKDERAGLKEDAAAEKWVPGVNALGTWGRWAFRQFEAVHDIDREFRDLIEQAVTDGAATDSSVADEQRKAKAAASGG